MSCRLIGGSDLDQGGLLAGLGPEGDVVGQANAADLRRLRTLHAVVFLVVLAELEFHVDDGVGEAGGHECLGNAEHGPVAESTAAAALRRSCAADLALWREVHRIDQYIEL